MTGAPPYRCSRAAEEAAHALAGTASTVRGFLLLEAPGAWGQHVRDAGIIPAEVRRHLWMLEKEHRVRSLLIRHGGRPHRTGLNVFAAYAGPGTPWLEHTVLDGYPQLLGHDFTGMAQGRRPGLTPADAPLFAACTHGRHDACCAERGRPVWDALRAAAPRHAWQVSHIGGDRFAANVLVLPEGLYYGRVDPLEAGELVRRHADGRLLLDRLRGRSSYPMPVQFAEIALRRRLGVDRLDAVARTGHRADDGVTEATFRVREEEYVVRVRSWLGEPERLTCAAAALSRPVVHQLLH